MSQQLALSSIASVLAMACLCFAAGSIKQADRPAHDAVALVSAETPGLSS